ncbi:HNH endonuclease [Nocardiopsis sp. CNT-189]|uniref:HNH endonuclease family protein n=1 Tax=Nocardiopsis oceanisediminis TaxID=2816862 RepID=UPI003B29B04E
MPYRTPRFPRTLLGGAAAVLLAAAGLAAFASPAGAGVQAASLPPGIPSTADARTQLAGLDVREESESSPYDRSLFPHWNAVEGNCNAREYVLRRDGDGVEVDDACRAVAGSWFSEFDGVTADDASDIQIDHMVALKEAWRSGADSWSSAKRTSFANNVEGPLLWAVTGSSNQSKGDKDPSDWMPPRAESHCDYAKAWINSKHRYDLAVDDAEKSALEGVLNGC